MVGPIKGGAELGLQLSPSLESVVGMESVPAGTQSCTFITVMSLLTVYTHFSKFGDHL